MQIGLKKLSSVRGNWQASAILIGFAFCTPSYADRILLADCFVDSGDRYFESGIRLVIAFNIDRKQEAIFTSHEGRLIWYGSDGQESQFEVHGGIGSITLAEDVRRSLRQLPFRFIEGDFPPSAEALSDDPLICEMDYAKIDEYENWVLPKNQKLQGDAIEK